MMTLGINCTELVILTPADRARVVVDIAGFGFEHVRAEIPWQLVQPAKGVWQWDAVRDLATAARANGVELLPILGVHMAPWAYTPTDFGVFCRNAAQVLRAPAYEIMNEPNLRNFNPAFGAPDPIVPLIKAASVAIKAAQPGAKIVFPGLAAAESFVARFLWWSLYGNQSPEEFLTGALKLGAGPWFDVMAYHPYSIGGQFEQQPPSASQVMIARTPKLRNIVSAAGYQRELWGTEWGFDIATLGVAEVAKRIAIQLPIMASMCERSYLFGWRDYPAHGGTFGLVDTNNVPRQPIYDTVKAALR